MEKENECLQSDYKTISDVVTTLQHIEGSENAEKRHPSGWMLDAQNTSMSC
jgi:hypothetical protein